MAGRKRATKQAERGECSQWSSIQHGGREAIQWQRWGFWEPKKYQRGKDKGVTGTSENKLPLESTSQPSSKKQRAHPGGKAFPVKSHSYIPNRPNHESHSLQVV